MKKQKIFRGLLTFLMVLCFIVPLQAEAATISSVKNLKASRISNNTMGYITYSKVTGARGYQIQYSTDSAFKKSVKTKKQTSRTYQFSADKKNTYYIRVRSYKTVKKTVKKKKVTQTIYSKWKQTKISKVPTTMTTTTPVLLMQAGTTYTPKISIVSAFDNTEGLTRVSADSNIAQVDEKGAITALNDGNTYITYRFDKKVLKIYVNVVTGTNISSADYSTLKLYNQSGKLITYPLFKQNAATYEAEHVVYLRQHGCATCSLTTVLGAFHSQYAQYGPDQVIRTIEKTVADEESWIKNHVTREPKKQMPLSMYGISKILNYVGVKATYIRTFPSEDVAKTQIYNHLKTGNPVIFEVKKQSNYTGEKDSPWTASVHTMVFLGRYTTGEVLIADSVNRSWYTQGQRAKISMIESPMEYMYSCTKFDTGMYYTNLASDGGYILVQ